MVAIIFGLYKTTPKDRIVGTFATRVQKISKTEYCARRNIKEPSAFPDIPDTVLQIHFDMHITNIGNSLVHMGLRDTEAKNETIQFGIIHFGNLVVPMRFQLDLDTTFILTKGLSNPYYYDLWYFKDTPNLENIKIEVFTKTGRSIYLKPEKSITLVIEQL